MHSRHFLKVGMTALVGTVQVVMYLLVGISIAG